MTVPKSIGSHRHNASIQRFVCKACAIPIHRLYTQNSLTLYQSAAGWHAQSSGVRMKEVWPYFDEHLPVLMQTITYHGKTCMEHDYILCPYTVMSLEHYEDKLSRFFKKSVFSTTTILGL